MCVCVCVCKRGGERECVCVKQRERESVCVLQTTDFGERDSNSYTISPHNSLVWQTQP